MTQRVYTIGYSGRKPQHLLNLAERIDAVIYDIRFSPRSRVAMWNGKALGQAWGDRYRHVGTLGNKNYKGGDIELVDYGAGKAAIAASPKPVLLMCVCHDPAICHRTFIARLLRGDGFEVEELAAGLQLELWKGT
jgi:uncharacterized protein (DUF488 family)